VRVIHRKGEEDKRRGIALIRLFKRRPRESEIFVLEEYEEKRWNRLIVPIGEEPSRGECEFFMVPGGTYRLRAQGIETGRQRTVWLHKEPYCGPTRIKPR